MNMERMRRASVPAAAASCFSLPRGGLRRRSIRRRPPAKKEGPGAPAVRGPDAPFTPDLPCSECHKEMKPNPTRRS